MLQEGVRLLAQGCRAQLKASAFASNPLCVLFQDKPARFGFCTAKKTSGQETRMKRWLLVAGGRHIETDRRQEEPNPSTSQSVGQTPLASRAGLKEFTSIQTVFC
jgi:hypothetical protein